MAPRQPLRIALTGASGLIGARVVAELAARGDSVLRLVRRAPRTPDEVRWDIEQRTVEASKLEGIDAVVHLAGENIAGRWTADRKRRIRESRVNGTRLLAGALEGLSVPPRVFVSASAVGYYGDRGDDIMTETNGPGSGFLPETCQAWEAAADPARRRGIRVVHPRMGIVLTRAGGALSKMLPVFRLGMGGRVGNGRQYMSWIALPDLIALIIRMIDDDSLNGAVNAVASAPVTNDEFTRVLADVLHRPAFLNVPAAAVRLLLGEFGREALLSSTRVVPHKLTECGFKFMFPSLESALRAIEGVRSQPLP